MKSNAPPLPSCKYCGTTLSVTRQSTDLRDYLGRQVFRKSLSTKRCTVCDGPERRRIHRAKPAV